MTTETDTPRAAHPNIFVGAVQFALNYWARFVVWIQGLYYLVMGLWPVLNIGSFEEVTGPKTDLWLVKTVGILIVVCGFVLVLSAYRRRIRLEVAFLGIGIALALIIIELVYVTIGTISPIYLLDAVVQALLIVGWFRRGGPYE
ncbi:MAG: hypothetical protein C4519_27390 [Desulfobacteraceae bacterium]|nr:MAG: hypothetical protein C4519_27390 [Desulfobacteraceae bacterium]